MNSLSKSRPRIASFFRVKHKDGYVELKAAPQPQFLLLLSPHSALLIVYHSLSYIICKKVIKYKQYVDYAEKYCMMCWNKTIFNDVPVCKNIYYLEWLPRRATIFW